MGLADIRPGCATVARGSMAFMVPCAAVSLSPRYSHGDAEMTKMQGIGLPPSSLLYLRRIPIKVKQIDAIFTIPILCTRAPRATSVAAFC